MRIAALYDIHGNLPALEAALHAARKAGADKVVLGGDIAAGPLPAETLEILMAFGDWVSAIEGAADRAVVTCYDLLMSKHQPDRRSFDDLVLWAAGRITGHQRDYLKALPHEIRLPSQDLGEIYFYHEIPGDAREHGGLPPGAQVIVAGRDHRQATEQRDGRLLVRPGSVGMPRADAPGAYWALLGEQVELMHTEYDAARARRRILRTGMPEAKAWAQRYVTM